MLDSQWHVSVHLDAIPPEATDGEEAQAEEQLIGEFSHLKNFRLPQIISTMTTSLERVGLEVCIGGSYGTALRLP